MKRKVVNPNPQEKKMQKMEEKIYDAEMNEQIIRAEELLEEEKNEKKADTF